MGLIEGFIIAKRQKGTPETFVESVRLEQDISLQVSTLVQRLIHTSRGIINVWEADSEII